MAETITMKDEPLRARVLEKLRQAGASEASAEAATKAIMHASLCGVDSHGVRLTSHYCMALGGGRINKNPELKVQYRAAASAVLDGDDGLGHYASYRAMEVACELAANAGVGAVGVIRSSHLGATGAYALEGARAGFISMATTNTDSVVALHQGAQKFHGTNPFAFGAPVERDHPWLLDMATSSIPMNRVMLYRTTGEKLPPGVAATAEGEPTEDPNTADMLIPLGGMDYGFKGAALAGLATILTAVLQGTTLDTEFIPMIGGNDISTPRNMGHFFLAVSPDHFGGRESFNRVMAHYLQLLRGSPAREGGKVMAPGDREWAVIRERQEKGIPVDLDSARFLGLE